VPATGESWTNWAGNQTHDVVAIEHPSSVDRLTTVVAEAAANSERVKAVGSGHSFTGIGLTDGRCLVLDQLDRVLDIDVSSGLVSVQAGITLATLNDALADAGLAFPNLGDIDRQTISGAIATSTHGTGAEWGGLATFVEAMTLVTADGRARRIDASDVDLLSVARVGLGALGIVAEVTLRCVPAFELHCTEAPVVIEQMMEAWDDAVAAHDHFEFWWVPSTEWVLTKANLREDSSKPGWSPPLEDRVISRRGLTVLGLLGRWKPEGERPYAIQFSDRSDRIFCSTRETPFYEMEYAIPAEHGMHALREVRRQIERHDWGIRFPVEVRVTAADDIALSTASERPTVYIAVHEWNDRPYEEYFREVEAIMRELDGRPHWGKLHTRTADQLAPLYPKWDQFQAVRSEFDPHGMFTNDYLDSVLGPI
jgi:L-gulono-1,4-lactone dehydrogenase